MLEDKQKYYGTYKTPHNTIEEGVITYEDGKFFGTYTLLGGKNDVTYKREVQPLDITQLRKYEKEKYVSDNNVGNKEMTKGDAISILKILNRPSDLVYINHLDVVALNMAIKALENERPKRRS